MSDAAKLLEPSAGWLTSAEAARMLRLSPSGFRSLIARGRIKPDHRAGIGLRGHRFRVETIEKFLESGGERG